MSWRDRMVSPARLGDNGKPDLGAVLDHYNVPYHTYRASQMVRCPLHEDNTPSLSINTDRQVWNCHSCGEGGDSWELLKKMEDTDFDGARTFAASVGLAAGDAGGSDSQLRPGSPRRRSSGRSSSGSRAGGGDGGYVPSWRRR